MDESRQNKPSTKHIIISYFCLCSQFVPNLLVWKVRKYRTPLSLLLRVGPGYEPWNAMLHRLYGAGGWCAAENNNRQYIQVDLEKKHKITQLALQRVYSKTAKKYFGIAQFKVRTFKSKF